MMRLEKVNRQPQLLLRFGKALARLRTRHQLRIRRAALDTIKKNIAKYRSVKRVTHKDNMWTNLAELKPIFDYLA